MTLPVQTTVWWYRGAGALVVDAGVHVSLVGSYRPPVLTADDPSKPPHTTMTLPVQIADWR
jgi:hypothetical protein